MTYGEKKQQEVKEQAKKNLQEYLAELAAKNDKLMKIELENLALEKRVKKQ